MLNRCVVWSAAYRWCIYSPGSNNMLQQPGLLQTSCIWHRHAARCKPVCVASEGGGKAQVALQLFWLPVCCLSRHCNVYGLICKCTNSSSVCWCYLRGSIRSKAPAWCCWSQGWLCTRVQCQFCYLALQGKSQSHPFYFAFIAGKGFSKCCPKSSILC